MAMYYGYIVKGHKPLHPGGKRIFNRATAAWLKLRAKRLKQPVVIHEVSAKKTGQLTEHYNLSDFACHDGTPVPPSLQKNTAHLAVALEEINARLGIVCRVLSGYRTPAYNKKVHGASQSQHLQASAADIDVPATHHTRDEIVAAARMVPNVHGIGIYPNGGVHVDVRPGKLVTWNDWKRT